MTDFIFSKADFIIHYSEPQAKSKFDALLQETWNAAVERGICRYKLENLETKILPGQHKFVAQLNVERALLRRKPQDLRLVKAPFNPNEFNFTKARKEEILLFLKNKEENDDKNENVIIINISPLEFCNSLLVPNIGGSIPQQATFKGLELLIQVMFLSCDRDFRAGFNSPGGYASVNHQHFHLYYLRYRLKLETIEVKHLSGPCYIVTEFPSAGFVFQVLTIDEMKSVAKHVHCLVDHFRETETAHNLFVTKGLSFDGEKSALRIYIWAREPSFGIKDDLGFNPALCELSGHLLMKETAAYERVNEGVVVSMLRNTTGSCFEKALPAVKSLFKDY